MTLTLIPHYSLKVESNSMIRITKIQLFCLIMLFEIGSTTLFALGIGAKQDAWLVVLTSSLGGFILLWVYTQIPKYYPKQNFAEILRKVVGNKLAAPLILLFGIYFFDTASHNFYEFGHLIQLTALPRTPLLIILYLFIFAAIYILCLGFEVFARTAEILFPVFLIFLVAIYIITLFSGNFDITELLPVLGNGMSQIMPELYRVIAFPYGEMVVFLMYWHYVDEQNMIRKTAFTAVILSTILIDLTLIVIISVLGPDLAGSALIPLLETILSINIADIITNLDLLAVLIMFIGGFYKMSLHLYGFALALTWIFHAKSPNKILILSGLFFPLYVVHRFPGLDYKHLKGDILMFTILLYAFIPILVLILSYLLKKKHPSPRENSTTKSHSDNQ